MKKITAFLKFEQGFTLIELIIVFSIIAILSTVGIASFVQFSRYQALQAGANEFITALNYAKSSAASQLIPSPSGSCNGSLRSYRVDFSTASGSNTQYTITAICDLSSPIVQTYTLPKSVTFTSSYGGQNTTTTSIVFPVINGGITGTGQVVILGFTNLSRVITISPSGIIK